MPEKIYTAPESLKRVASYAYNGISFSPEKRAKSVVDDFETEVNSLYKLGYEKAEGVGRLEEFKADFEKFYDKYSRLYIDWLSKKSRTLSPMITGPARFPVASNQKKLNYEMAASNELVDYYNKSKNRFLNEYRPEIDKPIKSGQNNAIELLKERLENAQNSQKLMIAANKIIRKGGDDVKPKLLELGLDNKAVDELLNPRFSGWGKGYKQFELSNNNAEINRLKKRIAQEEKLAENAKGGNIEYVLKNATVVENFEINRLQIKFDSIPDAEIRTKLKKAAFKWSPKEGAWQRQLSNGAKYEAENILGEPLKKETAAIPATPEPVKKLEPTPQPVQPEPVKTPEKDEKEIKTIVDQLEKIKTDKLLDINYSRKATPILEKVAVNHAGHEGPLRVTSANKITVIIDGYGTIPQSQFINKLIDNKRIEKTTALSKNYLLSQDFATELLLNNQDLFPNELAEPKKIAIEYIKNKKNGTNNLLVNQVEELINNNQSPVTNKPTPAPAEPEPTPTPAPAPVANNNQPKVEEGKIIYTWETLPDFAKAVNKPAIVKFKPSIKDKGLISLLEPFTSKDGLRPVMSGIYFDDESIVATDANILATLPNTGEQRGVYTPEGIKINEKYPNYKAVIPSPYNEGGYTAENVDLLKLKTYCHAATFISGKHNQQIVFPYGPYTGPTGEKWGFNANFLIECCDLFLKLGINTATFKYEKPNRPLLIIPNGKHKFITELAICMSVLVTADNLNYGVSDVDYNYYMETAFDFHTSNLINPDGSIAQFNPNIKERTATQGNIDYATLQLIKKLTPKRANVPILDNAAVINNTLYTTTTGVWFKHENIGLKDGVYRVTSGGLFSDHYDIDEWPKWQDIPKPKPFGVVSSKALSNFIVKGKKSVKSADSFRKGATGLKVDNGNLMVQAKDNILKGFEEAQGNEYVGIIIYDGKDFDNYVSSIPDQPIEIYTNGDKIQLKGEKTEFITNDIKTYTYESQEKAKALSEKEKAPEPAPAPVKPAPTPEPTPTPAPAHEPEQTEKPPRTLSYKQQLTLLIGRVKAKGGKMTESEVIAEGRKLHQLRTASGAALDKGQNSKRRLSPTPENLLRWAQHPGEFDLIGVDTINYLADPTADYKREINKQKIFNLFGVKI